MKSRPVYFEEIRDNYLPKGIDLGKIDKIIAKIRKMDTPSDPKEMVFRCIKYGVPKKPSEYSFERYYNDNTIPRRRLHRDEVDLCKLIQELINLCNNSDEFIKLFATLFERFVYSEESDKHPKSIYYNAKIFVNGSPVIYLNHQSIDIGIDEIDKKKNLETIECSLNSYAFVSGVKIDQLRFYAEALQKARQALGNDGMNISLRLIGGFTGKGIIDRIILLEREKLISSKVKIFFTTQLHPAEEYAL